jgi:glycosyltransferase involved in cell wall biosynthesis
MHLVFLVYDIHFGGGVERVAANMANHFVDEGYRITIISLSRRRPSNIFVIKEQVSVKYLNFHFENGFNLPQKILSVFKVSSFLRQFKNQTIVLGFGTFPSLILAMMPKRENLKTIGCQHSSYAFAEHIWAFLRSISFHRLNALVSLTERDLPHLKKHNPNSFVIPNSTSFFNSEPSQLENKMLLAIGRMDFNKGYDLLLDVFEKLTLSNPDWRLRIIGEGPKKEQIISRIAASDLRERVEILPPTDQIADHFHQASIYIMTSRKEGLPMVLLEAQACGLPIVSFDCETGPSDIITDNENGYLIDCFDIDMMAQKISILCSDRDLRIKFGKNAIKNVQKFRPEVINSMWENLFQSFTHTKTPSIDN